MCPTNWQKKNMKMKLKIQWADKKKRIQHIGTTRVKILFQIKHYNIAVTR
jgi:GrpB-like predicted nucleotidyltransferase (UPF0157 family)